MQALYRINESIGGYIVRSITSCHDYYQTYLVESPVGTLCNLKLYFLDLAPKYLFEKQTQQITELDVLRKTDHVGFPTLIACKEILTAKGPAQVIVTEPFDGVMLDVITSKSEHLSVKQSVQIFQNILDALKHLHSLGYCHNNICPSNILISTDSDNFAQFVDMGHVSRPNNGAVYLDTSDLDVYYCANSCFSGIYSEQSDIFSASAVLYFMLFGQAPWMSPIHDGATFSQKMHAARIFRMNQDLSGDDSIYIPNYLTNILLKGLGLLYNNYSTIDEILSDLNVGQGKTANKRVQKINCKPKIKRRNNISTEMNKTRKGFSSIAGMEDLKNELSRSVIFVLQNKNIAKKYKLTPPNGMLLYGPPGCGKTFFAEKFAEETGCHYMLIKPSSTASIFIHGSQKKIRELFDEAEKKAPTIICFDEFDAQTPHRSTITNTSESGEVNEFLTQLNNCAQRGIFVIATSNRPDKIDPAILRTGRIDKLVYVPMPDTKARKEIFQLHLKGRPLNNKQINYDMLAELTEGYIASDIAHIVNKSALAAALEDKKISQKIIENEIHSLSPSLRKDIIKQYEEIKYKMEGAGQMCNTVPIGYRINN